MTEPKPWFCFNCGERFKGLLSVPFKKVKCPACRRMYDVSECDGGLTILVREPKLVPTE